MKAKNKAYINMSFESDSSFCIPHLCKHEFQGDLPARGIRKEVLKNLALTVNPKYYELKRKAKREEKLPFFSCMPTWFTVDRSKFTKKCFNLLKFIRDSPPPPFQALLQILIF